MQISKRLCDALRELQLALQAESNDPDYSVLVRVNGGMVFHEEVTNSAMPKSLLGFLKLKKPTQGCPECGFAIDDHQAGCSRQGNLK